jgi:biotin carboxyl carrier protein
MTFRVEIDGNDCLLHLESSEAGWTYRIDGGSGEQGIADLAQVAPGLYSVLLENRQVFVAVDPASGRGAPVEVLAGAERHSVSISDARDRPANARRGGASGPADIRAQMPGKVIRLLVRPGDEVQSGQGLIVVEAMKMQNEMKSSRAGRVAQVFASEGATVAAGERLLTLE